jgi:hypothetical protein
VMMTIGVNSPETKSLLVIAGARLSDVNYHV